MKKVLLFLILASMFNILQAQVFKEDNEYTRTTRVKISDELENNSSILKILRQTNDVHIALSKQADGKAMFTYLKDGESESAKRFTSPYNIWGIPQSYLLILPPITPIVKRFVEQKNSNI